MKNQADQHDCTVVRDISGYGIADARIKYNSYQLFLLYSLQLHVGVGVALEKNIHQNMPPVTRASGKNDKIVQLPSQLFSQNSAKRLPVQHNHNKHHEHQGTPRLTRMCPLKLGKERTELLMERIHYIRTRPSNPK